MMCMCVYGCRIGIILVNAISCIQVNNFHHIRLFSLCCPFDFVVFLMHALLLRKCSSSAGIVKRVLYSLLLICLLYRSSSFLTSISLLLLSPLVLIPFFSALFFGFLLAFTLLISHLTPHPLLRLWNWLSFSILYFSAYFSCLFAETLVIKMHDFRLTG